MILKAYGKDLHAHAMLNLNLATDVLHRRNNLFSNLAFVDIFVEQGPCSFFVFVLFNDFLFDRSARVMLSTFWRKWLALPTPLLSPRSMPSQH